MLGVTSVGSNVDTGVHETKIEDVDTATETDGGADINSVVDNRVSFDDEDVEYNNNCVTSWTCNDDKRRAKYLTQAST